MPVIAVYNLKGGVGKTSVAVNMAHAAAVQSSRRTLLWDLDPQAAASWLLGAEGSARASTKDLLLKKARPHKAAQPTAIDRLDMIAADMSLRSIDRLFFEIGKKKRLARLLGDLDGRYDRIILDCPPGLGDLAEQVLRAARIVIVPMIPSPLSMRAYEEVISYARAGKGMKAAFLPVFSMVDRRRAIHKEALEKHPDWPVIPYSSLVERMGEQRAPVGVFAPSHDVTRAYDTLWVAVERRLATTR